MNILVREAKNTEADKLIDIYKSEEIDITKDNLTKNVKNDFGRIGKNRTIWFAEIDGEAVGAIQLIYDNEEKDKANGRDIAMIHHLRVSKDFEGKGIASKLNEVVEQTARKKGFKKLTLEVENENFKAKYVHEHWGYKLLSNGKNPKEIVLIKDLE